MSRTVAIIQARMGSTRLPGKVLKDVVGQTVLARVVQRTQKCRLVDQVVVATSSASSDNAIVDACDRLCVPCFCGSELDVLDRFLQAAETYSASTCVRITADCPLIDPEVSDHIVSRFVRSAPPVDYASNKIPQSYPRGLDTEVFTVDALRRAHRLATHDYERSHVTIYMYEHPARFRLLSIVSDVDRADWRWTVDTPEDLEFVRAIYERLGPSGDFGWRDVIGLLEREPSLREMNSHVVQKAVREG
jgi:spore coat polysaccharide biosynthesis protein SpsF